MSVSLIIAITNHIMFMQRHTVELYNLFTYYHVDVIISLSKSHLKLKMLCD